MYVADMRDWATAKVNVTTVAEREAQYSKVEVARAREARDLIRNSGFDSERDARVISEELLTYMGDRSKR